MVVYDNDIVKAKFYFGWDSGSKDVELSEEFMEKHWNDLNHIDISKYQKLSEEFMEKHWNDLNHSWISISQKLSEEFMEKHWNYIYNYQYGDCMWCNNKTKSIDFLIPLIGTYETIYYCPKCQR